jgi:AcrR family transcriptional regulator
VLDENVIAELVRKKVVSDTFRRLPPEKKEQVYQTALRLFGNYGYDGLAVGRFCHEAGISKGSFFQYFRSKSHLLEFSLLMFDDDLAKWVSRLKASETASLARDRLRYLFETIITAPLLSSEERVFYLFASRALHHSRVVIEGFDLERHLNGYLLEIVRRGVETGELRGDVAVEELSYLVSILLRALAGDVFEGQSVITAGTGIKA